MHGFRVPKEVEENSRRTPERSAWLERLPDLVNRYCERWNLSLGDPFEGENSCAWVAAGTRDGDEPIVLKLQMPHSECRDEAEGLRAWNGEGAVRLLDASADGGVLLLERCEPGTHLRSVPEAEQDRIIASLLLRLRIVVPEPGRFRPLAEMVEEWSGEARSFEGERPDAGIVEEALAVYAELARDPQDSILLATDLHAGNVLRAEREPWLMIDPKPYIGDPAYDATQHLLNCIDRLAMDPHGLIDRFSELAQLDGERLRRWTFARLATASWGDLERNVEVARRLLERIE